MWLTEIAWRWMRFWHPTCQDALSSLFKRPHRLAGLTTSRNIRRERASPVPCVNEGGGGGTVPARPKATARQDLLVAPSRAHVDLVSRIDDTAIDLR